MADDYGAKAALKQGVKADTLDATIFERKRFDFGRLRPYFGRMTKPTPQSATEAGKVVLRQELEKGLASGVSTRTPQQIREAIRKAREAA